MQNRFIILAAIHVVKTEPNKVHNKQVEDVIMQDIENIKKTESFEHHTGGSIEQIESGTPKPKKLKATRNRKNAYKEEKKAIKKRVPKKALQEAIEKLLQHLD